MFRLSLYSLMPMPEYNVLDIQRKGIALSNTPFRLEEYTNQPLIVSLEDATVIQYIIQLIKMQKNQISKHYEIPLGPIISFFYIYFNCIYPLLLRFLLNIDRISCAIKIFHVYSYLEQGALSNLFDNSFDMNLYGTLHNLIGL